MNKHILLVIKYLEDPSSITKEELISSRNAATVAYAAAAAGAAAHAAARAATYDDAAAAGAAADAYAAAHAATYWVGEYFTQTGENKQDYINEINKGL